MNYVLDKSKEELIEYVFVLNIKLKDQVKVFERVSSNNQLAYLNKEELFEYVYDTKKYINEMESVIDKLIEGRKEEN